MILILAARHDHYRDFLRHTGIQKRDARFVTGYESLAGLRGLPYIELSSFYEHPYAREIMQLMKVYGHKPIQEWVKESENQNDTTK